MEIPKRYSRYDRGIKDYTRDCNTCEFYRKIKGEELCGWGVAFKYLIQPKKMKKCEVKNRDMKKDMYGFKETHSVKYLDEIIKKGNLINKNDNNKLDRKTQATLPF
jgi:hypothetical protein